MSERGEKALNVGSVADQSNKGILFSFLECRDELHSDSVALEAIRVLFVFALFIYVGGDQIIIAQVYGMVVGDGVHAVIVVNVRAHLCAAWSFMATSRRCTVVQSWLNASQ